MVRRQATEVKRNVEAPSYNNYCSGNALSNLLCILSVCVSVVLVIQLAKRMRRIILSSVAILPLP